MKKYFTISIITNIFLALISFFGLMNYLILSVNCSFSTILDIAILFMIVIINIALNYILYKYILKEDMKKIIYILIPSSVFMFLQGILFFFIR